MTATQVTLTLQDATSGRPPAERENSPSPRELPVSKPESTELPPVHHRPINWQQQQPVSNKSSSRMPWWLFVVVGVAILAIVIAMIVAYNHEKNPGDQSRPAVTTCQDHVRDRLKSPSSADFGEPRSTFAAGDTADFYTVTGSVDAQNSFGAMLRSTYSCKITHERDGTWRITDFQLSGR